MVILVHTRRNWRLFSSLPLPAHLSHWRSRGFESRQVHLHTFSSGDCVYWYRLRGYAPPLTRCPGGALRGHRHQAKRSSIVDIPPCSLMVFVPPLHNQLSNEQGKNSWKTFSPWYFHIQAIPIYISTVLWILVEMCISKAESHQFIAPNHRQSASLHCRTPIPERSFADFHRVPTGQACWHRRVVRLDQRHSLYKFLLFW